MKGWKLGDKGWKMGKKGVGDGKEGGGRWERRKFEKLKQKPKEKIYAIRWEMGERGGRCQRVCPCPPPHH